jgi:hypothetical protein
MVSGRSACSGCHDLSTLLQEAIDLARRREQLTHDGYARRVQAIKLILRSSRGGGPPCASPGRNRTPAYHYPPAPSPS